MCCVIRNYVVQCRNACLFPNYSPGTQIYLSFSGPNEDGVPIKMFHHVLLQCYIIKKLSLTAVVEEYCELTHACLLLASVAGKIGFHSQGFSCEILEAIVPKSSFFLLCHLAFEFYLLWGNNYSKLFAFINCKRCRIWAGLTLGLYTA